MGNTRRSVAPESKEEAVKLVINTGRPVARPETSKLVSLQETGRFRLSLQRKVADRSGGS